MRHYNPLSAALSLFLAALPAAAATATVDYADPAKFTDVGRDLGRSERDGYLASLKRHLIQESARLLPADQVLAITVTDVDMAGDFEPRGRSDEVRIIRDLYPPRIDLRFKLARADGTVLREGERRLRDLAFMMGSRINDSDPLRFEKALLDRWLCEEFAAPKR